MSERTVMGIDGGGTSTRVVLVSEHGDVLGFGAAGTSNYDDVGVEVAKQNVAIALHEAWRQSGRSPQTCDAAFLGMAGVVSKIDRLVIQQIASDLKIAQSSHIGVDHDIRISLAGSLAGKEGIALVVGTGSSCYGRRTNGRDWRAGGWAHLLDDIGSGYYLGLHAMIAAVRATDGRGAATALTDAVLVALKLQDIHDIMRRLYHVGMSRSEIAAFAPMVCEAAAGGDIVAREIIERGLDELALMVETVAKKLGFTPGKVSVSVTGGLAHSDQVYEESLYAAIRHRVPMAEIVEPIMPPALGAALLALEMIHIQPTTQLTQQMRQSFRP
jgi:N-acetylglucosamine kinase-like BadF-type ATPase